MIPDRKQCAVCPTMFSRSRCTSPGRWSRILYCSKRCRLKAAAGTDWRLSATKQCPVCDRPFSPHENEPPHKWRARVLCSNICTAAHARGYKVAELDPAQQETAAQRVRWLRLAHNDTGTKQRMTAWQAADAIGIGRSTYSHLEEVGKVPEHYLETIANGLRVPPWLLTCSLKRFSKAVIASGLRAIGPVTYYERRVA